MNDIDRAHVSVDIRTVDGQRYLDVYYIHEPVAMWLTLTACDLIALQAEVARRTTEAVESYLTACTRA